MPGDVEHRHHQQRHVVRRGIAPVRTRHRVVHDARVRVHAALGQAGGAAGVGQDRQIIRPHLQRRRCFSGGQRRGPGQRLATRQRRQRMPGQQPVMPGGRRRVLAVDIGVEGVGEVGHDQVLQPLARRQGVAGLDHLGRQVGGGDGDAGVGVGDVVLEFLGPVHRIDRDHHRIGAQDGKVSDDQLRAVLHAQHDPVAAPHAELMQPRRQPLGLLRQLGVAQAPAEERDGRLVRIATGADRQVVPQRSRWRGDRMRKTFGPELVVRTRRHGFS